MSDYVVAAYGEALMKLMKKKSIEKITVDELCETGGIGRATYFRNFKSKDGILTAYIIMKWRKYEKAHKLKEHSLSDIYRVERYFEFCYSMRKINDLIIAQGHHGAILSAYEVIVTDSDTNKVVDNYESYYMAYGLFGILMKWAKNGYKETPQELAEIVVDRIFTDSKQA
ncbi:MAG: TetR/AcrR family transcriptional regulator C-terminal domain-containing protein [Oscillospiraceae bacterium]|nr:TetR/AcrR family transcriptional regulator C-terminal domain-containing protein [Oscillospiraceae bacterium]